MLSCQWDSLYPKHQVTLLLWQIFMWLKKRTYSFTNNFFKLNFACRKGSCWLVVLPKLLICSHSHSRWFSQDRESFTVFTLFFLFHGEEENQLSVSCDSCIFLPVSQPKPLSGAFWTPGASWLSFHPSFWIVEYKGPWLLNGDLWEDVAGQVQGWRTHRMVPDRHFLSQRELAGTAS